MKTHRHQTSLRGVKVVPEPPEADPDYKPVNYEYAGREGRIHEVVEIAGRELAKVGFEDKRIVYYYLEDLKLDESTQRRTFDE
ncbi:MAG TPA: hypothetical protein VIN40_08840 [Candidatus Tyrphobacter sp.]